MPFETTGSRREEKKKEMKKQEIAVAKLELDYALAELHEAIQADNMLEKSLITVRLRDLRLRLYDLGYFRARSITN